MPDHTILRTVWHDLARWLDAVHLVGAYPEAQFQIGAGSSYHTAGEPFALAVDDVKEVGTCWGERDADYTALTSPALSRVLENLGHAMGERLGLSYAAATHFGDWLAQAVTGMSGGHGNERMVAWCNAVASLAVYGTRDTMTCASWSPTFWTEYATGALAVVAALRDSPEPNRERG